MKKGPARFESECLPSPFRSWQHYSFPGIASWCWDRDTHGLAFAFAL